MSLRLAENFILRDQHGNNFELYKNLDKNILLIFYPKDNSLVCSKQLRDYQSNINKFTEAGIKPVAINIESVDSHKSFCDNKEINFPVLSDSKKSVSRKFNALNLLSLNRRKIVVINPSREVIYEKNMHGLNYLKTEEILADLLPILHQNRNQSNAE
jgi:peroxiredoxin Q/BCP